MNKYSFIYEQLVSVLGIAYEYMEWTDKTVPETYSVGECTEEPTATEDGYEESTMIITTTTRGKWLDLENIKKKIKKHFPSVGGLKRQMEHGAIAVFFDSSFPVPTGEADLKRIQINLKIKEWKGMD